MVEKKLLRYLKILRYQNFLMNSIPEEDGNNINETRDYIKNKINNILFT